MHEISDLATDPKAVSRVGRGGGTAADGTRDGIDIRVVVGRDGDIVTGLPTSTKNPR